jgi:serine/threonine protein kinase
MGAYIHCDRCDFSIGDVIDNAYSVERALGEGSFGKVFQIRRCCDHQIYALKLLKLWTVESLEREKLLKRFNQEFETGQIQSDYLVQSVDKGTVSGNPYILMEFCPGGDLFHGIENNEVDLSKSALEILYGLQALHKNGKVHRDLKPENVLIKSDGKVALTDFGISGDRNKRLTERGILGVPKEVFGTYAYMPPEQINPRRGDATVLPTTDIFSFGVMMYQLLTYELPFGELNNEHDLYNYVTNGKENRWNRDLLNKVPNGAAWLPLIENCLKADFRERLQTSDAVMPLVPHLGSSLQIDNPSEPIIQSVNSGYALRIMQGEEYGRVYKLNDIMQINHRRVITIGRDDEDIHNVLPIKETESSYVSRKHCTLEYNQISKVWILRDGQWDPNSSSKWKTSMNGTYIDSHEISTNGVQLNIGEIISIGDVKLRVEGY